MIKFNDFKLINKILSCLTSFSILITSTMIVSSASSGVKLGDSFTDVVPIYESENDSMYFANVMRSFLETSELSCTQLCSSFDSEKDSLISDNVIYIREDEGNNVIAKNVLKLNSKIRIISKIQDKLRNKYNVVGIKENFLSNDEVCEEVIIPSSVRIENIEDSAFNNCSNLKNVTWYYSTEVNSDMNFDVIWDKINNIFSNCHNLKKILFQVNKNFNVIVYCKYQDGEYKINNMEINGRHRDEENELNISIFKNCKKVEKIQFDKIKTIGCDVFNGCVNLNKIKINNNVKIKENAFKGCEKLKEIEFDNYIEESICRLIGSQIEAVEITARCPSDRRDIVVAYVEYTISSAVSNNNLNRGGNRIMDNNIEQVQVGSSVDQYDICGESNKNSLELPKNENNEVADIQDDVFEKEEEAKEEEARERLQYSYDSNKKVVIIEGLSRLDESVLSEIEDREKVKTVVLPDTMEAIETHTFDGFTSLKEIKFKGNSKTINIELRQDIYNIVKNIDGKISLCDDRNKNIFVYDTANECVRIYGGICKSMLEKFDKIEEIQIPNNIKNIGERAFAGLQCLEKVDVYDNNKKVKNKIKYNGIVNMPCELVKIGKEAFEGCKLIIELNFLGKMVKNIGDGAFKGCRGMRYIEIPKLVTKLEKETFENCENLETVKFNNVTSVGNNAFENCNLIRSSYSSKLTNIGERSFFNCKWNKNIKITNDKVGKEAFANSNIKSISINKCVTVINEGVFKNCKNITKVDLGNRVQKIKKSAFQNCKNLVKLTFGPSVEVVEEDAFKNCTGLKTGRVQFKNINAQYEDAFDGDIIETIIMPKK